MKAPKFSPAVISIFLVTLCLLLMSACTNEDVEMSTDPKWIKRHQPNANVAIVFVHGIFGDTIGTWTGDKASFFELLEQDSEVEPNVDIFAFGYTSNMLKDGSLAVDEAANILYARLENEGVLTYQSILFVNHSMGGLVVMRMLVQRDELRKKVPEIVLFGTPTDGSQIAKIASKIANNPSLVDMLPANSNTFLRTLDDDFKSLPNKPRVWCGYEKTTVAGIMIVPWTSASRLCDSSLAIDANHIDIVKPDRIEHDSYLVVRQALRKLLTPCRHNSHGIERYSKTTTVSRNSNWMSGGYSQAPWCEAVINALKVEYPNGIFERLRSSEKSRSRCPPLNCPEYRYTCEVQVQTEPVYINRVSNDCARFVN